MPWIKQWTKSVRAMTRQRGLFLSCLRALSVVQKWKYGPTRPREHVLPVKKPSKKSRHRKGDACPHVGGIIIHGLSRFSQIIKLTFGWKPERSEKDLPMN